MPPDSSLLSCTLLRGTWGGPMTAYIEPGGQPVWILNQTPFTRGYGYKRGHTFFFNNFINDCRDASCLVLTCRVLYNSSYSLASVTTETALGYTWGFSVLPDFHSHSHAFTDRSCSLFTLPCFLIVRAAIEDDRSQSRRHLDSRA